MDYYENLMSDFKQNKEIVQSNGCHILRQCFTEEFYSAILNDISNLGHDCNCIYSGQYYTYHILFEEGMWEKINSEIQRIYDSTNKKGVLRRKLHEMFSDSIDQNRSTLFEIAALCRFSNNNILVEIEPKISCTQNEDKKVNLKADISVKPDNRIVLLEFSAFCHGVKEIRTGAFMVDIKKNIETMQLKIFRKNEHQLCYSDFPIILVLSLPRDMTMDQRQAHWAIDEIRNSLNDISGIIIADSEKFLYGVFHNNNKARHLLTEREIDYFNNLLLLDDYYKDFKSRFIK